MASSQEENTTYSSDVIKPGTLLLKCSPLVHIPKSFPIPGYVCDSCLTLQADVDYELKRCSGCQMVHYCNGKCQKKGWKDGHKYECSQIKLLLGLLPKGFPKVLPWLPRMLLRLVVKLQDGKDYYDELEIGGTTVKRRFNDLMIDRETLKGPKYNKKLIPSVIDVVKRLLRQTPNIKIPSDAELLEMCGKVLSNKFNIGNDDIGAGIGLYLGASVFPHSCDSMAVCTFERTTMCVRNFREIPKTLPIDKVTISYIPALAMAPTEKRRKKLKEQLHFDCQCERCKTGQFDKEMRSIICRNDGCNAEIDSEEINSPCHVCGHVLGKEEVAGVLEAGKSVRQLLEEDSLENLQSIELCITILKAVKFSDTHWMMVQLYEKATTKAIRIGQDSEKYKDWKKVYEYGSKYLLGIRRYLHENDIELMHLLLKLSDSCFSVSNLDQEKFEAGKKEYTTEAELPFVRAKVDEAEKYISEAKSIAEVVFGENSHFVRTHIDPKVKILRSTNRMFGMDFPKFLANAPDLLSSILSA